MIKIEEIIKKEPTSNFYNSKQLKSYQILLFNKLILYRKVIIKILITIG